MKTAKMVAAESAADFKALEPFAAALQAFFNPMGLRMQTDNHDAITAECGLRCPPEENLTRQEFKAEADINNIVARFYPFAPPASRPVEFGERDMSLDLQSAMLAMQSARETYLEESGTLRAKFPTFDSFLEAFMAGKVEFKPADDAGVSLPASSAGSPSESAAGGGEKPA